VRRLVVLVFLLASCSRAQPSPKPPAPDVTRVEITAGESDAAMGLRVLNLKMTNTGTKPYMINGYPAVQVLDDAEKTLDIQVGEGSLGISTVEGFDDPPAQVTLQPGENAIATLLWRNTVTRSDVNATSGTYLDVAPTKGQPTQRVRPSQNIDLGNTGKLGVSPWKTPPQPRKGDVDARVPN
jgi:hypothetical protein